MVFTLSSFQLKLHFCPFYQIKKKHQKIQYNDLDMGQNSINRNILKQLIKDTHQHKSLKLAVDQSHQLNLQTLQRVMQIWGDILLVTKPRILKMTPYQNVSQCLKKLFLSNVRSVVLCQCKCVHTCVIMIQKSCLNFLFSYFKNLKS